MPRITPCLWFDRDSDAAMALYTSVFAGSRIEHVERYPDESLDEHFRGMAGKVITGVFEVAGRQLMCLDGGPMFTIDPSVSFFAVADGEDELRRHHGLLVEGGRELMPLGAYPWSPLYAWVQDRFGVTWQLMLRTPDSPPGAVTPALMFTGAAAGRAEEAMVAWATVFEGSAVDALERYREGDGDTPGLVKHARFHLGENGFAAMDSTFEHGFGFSEAVSLSVACRDQVEMDRYWDALTADGGEGGQCGWLKDRFGVSWQIVPENLGEVMGGRPEAVQALMGMGRIDVAALERAGR